jgi:hypothetical protein
LFSVLAEAQNVDVSVRYASTISLDDLRVRLEVIAADSMLGRDTGHEGQKKAASYIQSQFEMFGIPPLEELDGYQQSYSINVTYPDTIQVIAGKDTFRLLEDIYAFNLADMRLDAKQVVYAGYGIHSESYSDFEGLDVRGKVLLVSSGEPRRKGKSLVDISASSTQWSTDWRRKIQEAQSRGARALLVVDGKFATSVVQLGRYIQRPNMDVSGKAQEMTMPVVFLSSKLADHILRRGGERRSHKKLERIIEKRGRTVTLSMNSPVMLTVNRHREKLVAENVLGFIEGSDLREQVLAITCHYDHLGMKDEEIYNGADDDGSGSTALLELAETFAQAKREGNGPRRSILFMAFSGEEKGLLGSEFYTDNPIIPLERTFVNLNIDMIGRIDERHAPDSNYVYLIGSDKISQDLHDISEHANATYTQLELDYTFNDERDPNRFYYRSDHYNFAKNGIPVIFYFTGVHEDYHKPTDTVEKIMFPKMQRIVQLIFHTAWELANRDGDLRK